MNTSMISDKLASFEETVMDFYRKAGRESLPWRKEGITAYEVWVSEIMLQQTQVSRVLDYYVRFLGRFPTIASLAQATWEEFLPYYAGLGYYRRGRNMLLAAQKVMNEFGGEFPRDKKLLMSLPGVGEYTASAILSFAYGEDFVAWDTNLKRVIGRYFFGSKHSDVSVFAREPKRSQDISGSPGCARDDNGARFETHAKVLNAALMDFGSAICLGRPKCAACPLTARCAYFPEAGKQEFIMRKSVLTCLCEGTEAIPSDKLETAASRSRRQTLCGIHTDWKNAQVYLWLHRDHKLYYSSIPDRFEVFVLSATYNSRAGIKAYFKETYGLDLAVRPPHDKLSIDGKPTLFVNAQILLGTLAFATFSKEAVKRYNESEGESLQD